MNKFILFLCLLLALPVFAQQVTVYDPNWVANSGAWGTAVALALPLPCSDSSGSGTVQVCTTPVKFTPARGSCIIYTTTTTNTGDMTINVNASSAAHVRKYLGSSTLTSGDLVANVPVTMCYDGTFWETPTIGNAPVGSGTVTSVTFTGDGVVDSATPSSAVTSSGTLTATLISQAQNLVLASPNGGSGTPTFRGLVPADSSSVTGIGTSFVTDNGPSINNVLTIKGTTPELLVQGATSGSWNLTATATGGTLVYGSLGSLANPAWQATGAAANTGAYFPNTSSIAWVSAGTAIAGWRATGMGLFVNGVVGWTASGGNPASGTFDTTISRFGIGSLQIGSGSGSGTTGGLKLSYLQSAGTKFTASGCTNGTTLGGATAGSFHTGAGGACTITITMGDTDTATNGWACYASDQTTAAGNPIFQSGGSTTTAVLVSTASTANGDVISFGCMAY